MNLIIDFHDDTQIKLSRHNEGTHYAVHYWEKDYYALFRVYDSNVLIEIDNYSAHYPRHGKDVLRWLKELSRKEANVELIEEITNYD